MPGDTQAMQNMNASYHWHLKCHHSILGLLSTTSSEETCQSPNRIIPWLLASLLRCVSFHSCTLLCQMLSRTPRRACRVAFPPWTPGWPSIWPTAVAASWRAPPRFRVSTAGQIRSVKLQRCTYLQGNPLSDSHKTWRTNALGTVLWYLKKHFWGKFYKCNLLKCIDWPDFSHYAH